MRLSSTLALGAGIANLASGNKCVKDACAILDKTLPGSVAYPNSTMYIDENDFWSNRQAEVHPRCFVAPRTTTDVSIIMKILTSIGAPFTVKGGGHTAFEGASNIEGGVTIDLVKFKQITVSEDRKTVSVGAGTRWIEVSEKLDPLGLAVVAGRAADVGVSGLTLGGGISYFSGKYGWACDNVRNYEIVLSSGKVVNASPEENTDLYWALRGSGGSNWGIVTRFDLVSFDQGDLWTSSLVFPGQLNSTLIPLFIDLTFNGLPKDEDAHTYFVISYQPTLGGYIVLNSFFHATLPPADTTPEVFQPFQSVPGALLNTTLVTNISAQSRSIDEAYGVRQTWWDTSVDPTSPQLLQDIVTMYEEYTAKVLEAAAGTEASTFLIFQPISVNILEAMQKNGGNPLGLKPADGPLMIVQLTTMWADESIDSVVEGSSAEFISAVEKEAESKGLLRGYVYMNYAGMTQDVLKSYGKENYKRLKKIAAKWDPERHLQKLWKGYFQLDGKL